jgi:hypothetical protein
MPDQPFNRNRPFDTIPYDQEAPTNPWGLRQYAKLAGGAALAYGGFQALKQPTNFSLGYLDVGISSAGLTWKGIAGAPQWRDYALNVFKAFEEETPLQLGRTFGLTELLSPYVLGKRGQLHIPAEVLQGGHRKYYEALLSGHEVSDFTEGLQYREGKLYGLKLDAQGTRTEEEVLSFARLRLSRWQPEIPKDLEDIANPVLHGRYSAAWQEALGRSRGMSARISRDDPFPFQVVGSTRSKWRFAGREVQAVAETWNRRFFRLLDDPIEFLADIGYKFQEVPVLGTAASWLSKTGLTNRFGLGGKYQGNIAEQWGRWLKPGFGKGGKFRPGALLSFVGLPFAYHALDNYFRDHEAYKGTIVEDGLSGAAASTWQRLMLARANVGKYTGLSWLANKQEEIAPGSTDLGTLAGMPLAAGTAAGLYAFGAQRLGRRRDARDIGKVWEAVKMPSHRFEGFLGKVFKGQYTRAGKLFRGGLALGAIAELPFVLGAAARLLGGSKSPEELKKIYSGEQEVPVSTSRFWEAGSSPWKGSKVNYFRPHWTVLAKSNYQNEALFTGDESWLFKAAKRTPILSDIVDPYYLEKKHYHDRPYPLAGPSVPGLGPFSSLYAGTLGRLFKPVRTMHTEEWQTPEGYKYQKEENAPVPELGGLPPGAPVSPYNLKRIAAETFHAESEAIGLPGWFARLALNSEKWGTKDMQLASSERMTSQERSYWDTNLGGLMGSTEWYRRVNIRRRQGIRQNEYNPLANTMPDWLPGRNYFIDFKSGGDPYTLIPQGEARLPGPGFVALHPELEGVDPEDYPLLTRLKILSDVAPWSAETKIALKQAHAAQDRGHLSDAEIGELATAEHQINMIKQRKDFSDYQDFSGESVPERGLGRYWEDLTHHAEMPWEPLTPFRPAAKFIHARDPIEDYEKSVIHNADSGFWNKPWSNFIRPAIEQSTGIDDLGGHLEKVRETEEYFDKLKYVKAMQHIRQAGAHGNKVAANKWKREAATTLTGADPLEDMTRALRAFPKREQDYFAAFSQERDPKRQGKILFKVPENVARIYRLLWEQQSLDRLKRQAEAGELDARSQEYQDTVKALQIDMSTGSRLTPERIEQYQKEHPKTPIKDWLAEQETQEFFQDHNLPAQDSLLYDARVDLEDVKLKVVKNEAGDIHDYSLWESRERMLSRKPYLDEVVDDLDDSRSEEDIRRQIKAACEGYGLQDIQVQVLPGQANSDLQVKVRDDYNDRRQDRDFRRNHGKYLPLQRQDKAHTRRPESRLNG